MTRSHSCCGHREDHPVAQHPGVVDQDVQLPVLLERRRHQLLAGRPLRDIPGGHHRLAAGRGDLGGHRLDGVPRQVVEHQPRPGPGQRQRLRPAQPVPAPVTMATRPVSVSASSIPSFQDLYPERSRFPHYLPLSVASAVRGFRRQ